MFSKNQNYFIDFCLKTATKFKIYCLAKLKTNNNFILNQINKKKYYYKEHSISIK